MDGLKGHMAGQCIYMCVSLWECVACHMSLLHFFELKIGWLWDHSGSLRIKGLSFVLMSIWHHVSGQILSVSIGHASYLHSLDFGLGGQWSDWRNCFWQKQLLTMTSWPCSFSFHAQVMILTGSYRVFHLASTSIDGCCLYIIIHNGIFW